MHGLNEGHIAPYQLIAQPGNKTAAVLWPDPYIQNFFEWRYIYEITLLKKAHSMRRQGTMKIKGPGQNIITVMYVPFFLSLVINHHWRAKINLSIIKFQQAAYFWHALRVTSEYTENQIKIRIVKPQREYYSQEDQWMNQYSILNWWKVYIHLRWYFWYQ